MLGDYLGIWFCQSPFKYIIIRKEIICQQDEPKLVGLLWTHLPSKTFLFFLLGPNFLQFPKKFRTDAYPSHLDINKIPSAKKFNNFIIIIIIG